MNAEAQRIAIAEACGWTRVHYRTAKADCWLAPGASPEFPTDKVTGVMPWPRDARDSHPLDTLGMPDYLNSLDAMHEAEKTLTEVQQVTYAGVIADMVKSQHWNHLGFDCLHTTATQRAEAFLRTLNLWV